MAPKKIKKELSTEDSQLSTREYTEEQKIILKTINDNKAILKRTYNYLPIYAKIIYNIYKDKIGCNQKLGFYLKNVDDKSLSVAYIRKIIIKTYENTLLTLDEDDYSELTLATLNSSKELNDIMIFMVMEWIEDQGL